MKPIDFKKIIFYPVRAHCTCEDLLNLLDVNIVELQVSAATYYNVAFPVRRSVEDTADMIVNALSSRF